MNRVEVVMREQRLLTVGAEILKLIDSVFFSAGSTGQLRMHEAGPSKAGCLRRSAVRPDQAERRSGNLERFSILDCRNIVATLLGPAYRHFDDRQASTRPLTTSPCTSVRR